MRIGEGGIALQFNEGQKHRARKPIQREKEEETEMREGERERRSEVGSEQASERASEGMREGMRGGKAHPGQSSDPVMTEIGQISSRLRMTQISKEYTVLTRNRSKCYAYVLGHAGHNSIIGQSGSRCYWTRKEDAQFIDTCKGETVQSSKIAKAQQSIP